MSFKWSVRLFVFCIDILSIQCVHSTVDYEAVPKSVDYKLIRWHGHIGKYNTSIATIYITKLEEISLFVSDRMLDAVLYIHDKKTDRKNEYSREYWTKDGHAILDHSDKELTSKKLYCFYKNLYKKIKK